MRSIIVVALCLFCSALFAQVEKETSVKDPQKKSHIVEVSCGECQFGLKGEGCDLAIRMNDKAYFVDGTKIDSHGDAHAADGFCKAIRKAEVQGEVIDDRFKVTYFKLLPNKEKKKDKEKAKS